MKVKVCGNNNQASLSQMQKNGGVDLFGFIFYPKSPRNVSPKLLESVKILKKLLYL